MAQKNPIMVCCPQCGAIARIGISELTIQEGDSIECPSCGCKGIIGKDEINENKPAVDIAPTEKPIERQELTFLELRARIWTPGELAEYPISNLRQLKREVRQAISISPFDTGLRAEEQLLSKAIRCSNAKG